MTVEEAIYYKYLLLCGYPGELDGYVDEALEREEPLSPIVLDLSTCSSDHNDTLCVLNSFIIPTPEERIDHNKVFSLVLTFLRRLYREEKMPMDKLTDLMYRISVLTDKACENPWFTMNILGDMYYEAQIGFVSMDSYGETFNRFMNEGICIDLSPAQNPMENFPQVLLLGNGMNIAYGGASWNELLRRITVNKALLDMELSSPMPLRAVLLTDNHIRSVLKNERQVLMGRLENEHHAHCYKKLLDIGFDHILTTNYSYELEIAANGGSEISEGRLKRMLSHTDKVKRAEGKYMLHTYYNCPTTKIWHIHGEARKPDSMVLGHYYYGSLFFKLKAYVDSRRDDYYKNQEAGKPTAIDSWVDAFILGDVYVLGYGFDLSEFDLWWLLERKAQEKAKTGRLFYYAPSSEAFDEKLALLKVYGNVVCHMDCGITIPLNATREEKNELYKEFYQKALLDLQDITG